MESTNSQISVEFAKTLLSALYRMDQPINELSEICGELPEGTLKERLFGATGNLMNILLSELMVPIYRQQPSLGTASEPGPWLTRGAE
jgi:hypothetical protein